MTETTPMFSSGALAAVALALMLASPILPSQQNPTHSHEANNPASPQPDTPYVFHFTTREVLLDVIAVDPHDHPITDLRPDELQVFDRAGRSAAVSQTVSSLRLIDPSGQAGADAPQAGFHIAANESCLQRNSLHYLLAYHPGEYGLISGFHQVTIRTGRRGARLFYSHRYYIGATAPPDQPKPTQPDQIAHELQHDACSHPLEPLSISLRAVPISTGSTEVLRYSVNIESGSLAFVSFSDNGRQLQLDYGACNFNAAGRPINFLSASTDQVLSPVEYARAEAHGFHRIFEFVPPKDLAMTRFVVRDRSTGNLGLADVIFPWPQGPPGPDPALLAQLKAIQADDVFRSSRYFPPPMGPIGTFGSVVPRPNAFCGDVYEMQPNTAKLPDFRDLDSIGSIYTESLLVPDQIFLGTNGIPGVTDRTIWFGVDYRATFWIRNPGEYQFRLTSDDGAMLQIDDQRIINLDGLHMARTQSGHITLAAGRHTIHIPYYEGTPDSVALVLAVRPPGEDESIFDLRDFAPPDVIPPVTPHR